jgi:hypothetical protein
MQSNDDLDGHSVSLTSLSLSIFLEQQTRYFVKIMARSTEQKEVIEDRLGIITDHCDDENLKTSSTE